MDEDTLTQEQVQEIRANVWAHDAEVVMNAVAPSQRLVAEGDSWFDYPPGLDILTQLRLHHDYSIVRVAEAGDTLENMAFGTEIRRNFTRREPQLVETRRAVARYRPPVVLLSGGGNDFAGTEFEAYLNHAATGLPALRVEHLDNVISGTFRRALAHIADGIWAENAAAHLIIHGYGYAIPDGRAVINLPFGFRFVGPWLRPALAKKNHLDLQTGRNILVQVIDRFNAMLSKFAEDDDRIHYIDLRDSINEGDWVNELHLKNSAYRRVAERFHTEIQAILNENT